MGRITAWLAATAVILALAFGYRTSLSGPRTTLANGGGAQHPGVRSAPSPSASNGSASGGNPHGDIVVNGAVAQTVWGPVQVQVHIRGSKIVAVVTLVRPSGTGRDDAINSYALPILRQETLTAQSAQVQTV